MTRHAALAPLLAALLWLAPGCGDQAEAPPEDLPALSCPTIDQAMSGTLEAVAQGQAEPMRQVLDEAASDPGDPIAAALRVVLALVTGLAPDELALPEAGAIDPALVGALEPALAGALRTMTEAPADSPEALDGVLVFDALAEAARACPQGSITGLLRLLLADRPLLSAVADVVADPRFARFFAPLLAPGAGDAGRRGVITLLDTVVNLVMADDFTVDDLRGPLGLIIPADEPPMDALLVELDRALSGAGLAQTRTVLACVEAVERADSTGAARDGIFLLGGAVHALLTGVGPDPSALLAGLESVPIDPLLAFADGLLARLAQDEALRADVLALMDHFLAPQRARGLLEGMAALLEAGLASELTALAQAFLSPECGQRPEALTAQLTAALTGGTMAP